MYKGGTAFFERLEMGGTPVDPIQAWHNKNHPVQQTLPIPQKEASWKPYKDEEDKSVEF